MKGISMIASSIFPIGLVVFFVLYFTDNEHIVERLWSSKENVMYALLALNVVLIGVVIFQFIKMKNLPVCSLNEEQEDEIEVKKYRLFADMTVCSNVSITLSILALGLGFIWFRDSNPWLALNAFFLIIGSVVAAGLAFSSGKKVYPDREPPSTSEDMLDVLDDGEKFVVLEGLHKAYQLLIPFLYMCIMTSVFYTAVSGHSQIFSIVLMTIILIAVQMTYGIVVRNR
ncbi:DUF3169 family protein [Priestia endophytica]|uniref:DUF3169 family protein n=1 Tax=Priestia endophytica TaxID=135735 RepID=UPI000DCA8B9A|nr:DUF3169 family protein [Priestia endophytica]RAS76569.1 hypothetical protein A4R27_21170 [Priestia endophytica]